MAVAVVGVVDEPFFFSSYFLFLAVDGWMGWMGRGLPPGRVLFFFFYILLFMFFFILFMFVMLRDGICVRASKKHMELRTVIDRPCVSILLISLDLSWLDSISS